MSKIIGAGMAKGRVQKGVFVGDPPKLRERLNITSMDKHYICWHFFLEPPPRPEDLGYLYIGDVIGENPN